MRISGRRDFEQLYNQYWEMVYSICCYYLKDTEESKDLVQDIFRSLWERKEKLDVEKDAMKGYLIRSAKYRVSEHIRNKTISKKHLTVIKSDDPVDNSMPEDIYQSQLLSEKITKLVENLPDQCQRVFVMSRSKGLSNAEISDLLQISKRTVEYHISKALCVLRQNLKEYPFV